MEFKTTSKTYARNHVIHGTYVCFFPFENSANSQYDRYFELNKVFIYWAATIKKIPPPNETWWALKLFEAEIRICVVLVEYIWYPCFNIHAMDLNWLWFETWHQTSPWTKQPKTERMRQKFRSLVNCIYFQIPCMY